MRKSAATKTNDPGIDLKRYRKVRWFFIKVLLQTLWWDILLNRPVLKLLRSPALPRWRDIARRYRALAVEMGGVLIKLGQFLSIRVDILPNEVIKELAGLQDEVPPEGFEAIARQMEADFGRPLTEVFAWVDPEPLGAASLAQAHEVRLPSGTKAVAKVLRPGIQVLVETDLAAVALAFRWLKFYKRVADRVDLDWLLDEFTTVTRRELDLKAEGENAERLALDLADDPHVYLPQVYWDYSAQRTLTLENVGYIKIGDLRGLDAAGIDRARVADRLYNVYMRQVFETYFVHVDPHPGNLFVRPLPTLEEVEAGIRSFAPSEPVPYSPDRPFQIVFVDFGMAVTIPERLRASLREYAIGVGTQDAYKIVQSLVSAGALMPGADLKRLEEAHEVFFQRLWGTRSGQFRDIAYEEARYFLREYRDVIYEAPFQFQADMLFVLRAVGILSGMAANLDPDFDPWTKTIPYAERFASEELRKGWAQWFQEAANLGAILFGLPGQLEGFVKQARRGKLSVETTVSPDVQRAIGRLEKAVRGLGWMVLAGALLLASVQLHARGEGEALAKTLMAFAVVAFGCAVVRR